MRFDQESIERALDELRQRDAEYGESAAALADSWRKRTHADSVTYSYPDLPAYRNFHQPFVAPRRRFFARVVGRLGFAPTLRVRTKKVSEHVLFIGVGCSLPGDFQANAALAIKNASEDFLYGDSVHFVVGQPGDYAHQLRPGWSPERLLSHCYVGDVIAVHRSVVKRAGGIRSLKRMGGHDRALSLADASATHRHLDVLLYTSSMADAVPQADPEAARKHCRRMGINADCSMSSSGMAVRVRRTVDSEPRIAVVIPTRGTSTLIRGENRVLVLEAVRSFLQKSNYANLEFLVVADSETPEDVLSALRRLDDSRLNIIPFDQPFNFARKINLAAVQTSADYLLLVNDDTEIIDDDVLETLLGHMMDGSVGIVSPQLYFEDGTIQSAGHLLNPVPLDLYRGYLPASSAGWGMLQVAREVSSLLAAFVLVRREDFLRVGGMNESFPADYNDVDFALKLRMDGKRAIVTPQARCWHFESKTRFPGLDGRAVGDLGRRWQHILENDPYGNKHLQPYEFIWKSNEDTRASLDAAVGASAEWDGEEWKRLQRLSDRHLHRTMFFPKWVRL